MAYTYREFDDGIIYLGNSEEVLRDLKGYDHVLTDPPYGYLDHKIETFFDYKKVFSSIRGGINPKGGLLLFGRGDLFFEWNIYLRDLGFLHKEDCALVKNNPSAVLLAMPRRTEYYTIRGLDGFTLNKVNIPLTDEDNISDSQIARWLRGCAGKGISRQAVLDYLTLGKEDFNVLNTVREEVSVGNFLKPAKAVSNAKTLVKGATLTTALNSSRELLEDGSHPTIKPSKEMAYLVKAISKKGDTILDPFMGSGSTAIACLLSKRRFIGIELAQEYFDLTCKRIEKYYENLQLDLFDLDD